MRGEAGQGGRVRDVGLKRAERAQAVRTFGAGQGDVRMVGARVRYEPALSHGGGDEALQGGEWGRGRNGSVEDAGAVEDAGLIEMDCDGRMTHGGQVDEELIVLRRRGGAEELQRDVPGGGCGPAEVFGMRAQTADERFQSGAGSGAERDADEETHTGIV